jgi:hypothetical protein
MIGLLDHSTILTFNLPSHCLLGGVLIHQVGSLNRQNALSFLKVECVKVQQCVSELSNRVTHHHSYRQLQ